MDISIINPLEFHGWDALVLTADNYSFFHSSAWIRVLCESYGYKPVFFALSHGGNLSAVIPMLEVRSHLTGHRGVSLPFSDYCKPLTFDGARLYRVPDALIGEAKRAGWKYLDFRGEGIVSSATPVWSRYVCHGLKMPADEKGLLAGFHKNTLRNIKKAEASGVRVVMSESLESLQDYYRLHCLTRKRQGVPPQPFQFFRKVFDHIISKGRGMTVLAYREGEPVAGAVYFHFGRKAMYKYGASDTSGRGNGDNAAVMREALRKYTREGYDYFCFGRTDRDMEGLRRFKAGFGATEYPLSYYRFDIRRNAFLSGHSHAGPSLPFLFRHMPVSGLRLVGYAYGHFG